VASLGRILIPSTTAGRAALTAQVVGLFVVFYLFNPRVGLDNRVFTSVLAVLLVWLVPVWCARVYLESKGLLRVDP